MVSTVHAEHLLLNAFLFRCPSLLHELCSALYGCSGRTMQRRVHCMWETIISYRRHACIALKHINRMLACRVKKCNTMQASDSLKPDDARQLLYDLNQCYDGFIQKLSAYIGKKK